MNVKLFFLITSISILILSIIAICCAPIINKINSDNFNNWKTLNCGIFSDLISTEKLKLEEIENYKYLKNLCYRQKAMSNLEYASLIFSVSLSFICSYLSLLLKLGIGKNFKNKTGLIGFISGIICFVLTFVYFCFSGYIFNNDVAYGKINGNEFSISSRNTKLFPNGALYKWINNKYITAYEKDNGKYDKYIKYKDLGNKQYNYDNELFKKYYDDSCYITTSVKPSSYINSCNYIFYYHYVNNENKYLYNRWLTTLVLSCFIFIFDICLSFFGFLLFKDKREELETVNNNSLPNIIQFSSKANPHNNENEIKINESN